MNAVDALRRYVNAIIESASDPTTTYGVEALRPAADEPTTTGRSGRMQGASTVSTPAINEMIRNVIEID